MKIENLLHSKRWIALALVFLAPLLAVQATIAQGIEIDPTYGINGVIGVGAGPVDEASRAVAVQPDGKVLLAGRCRIRHCMVRLNADGTLDTAFNGNGRVVTDEYELNVATGALLLQPDGKIVLAGGCRIYTLCFMRRNADGTADTGFGDGGTVAIAIPAEGWINSVVMVRQSTGRLVALGSCRGNQTFCAAAVQSNGTLDTSFGTGGMIFDAAVAGAVGAVVLAGDKIMVLAGCEGGGACFRRLMSNGVSDGTFGTSGRVAVPLSLAAEFAMGSERFMTAQGDGKLVVAGRCTALAAPCVARFNANGTPDTTFNGSGRVQVNMDALNASLVHSDGRISVAGVCLASNPQMQYACVTRYTAAGAMDLTFNGGTRVATALVRVPMGPHAVSLAAADADKVVVTAFCSVGSTYFGDNFDFCAERMLTTSAKDTTFAGTGTVKSIQVLREGGAGRFAALLPDGGLAYAAQCSAEVNGSGFNYDTCFARFDAAGRPVPLYNGLSGIQIDLGDSDQAQAVAGVSDGKLLLVSACTAGLCLSRFNLDGSLDVSFGIEGKRIHTLDGVLFSVLGMLIVDGKTLIGAACLEGSQHAACVMRFNADGTPDLSFNGNGRVLVPYASVVSDRGEQRALSTQPDGKILLAVGCYREPAVAFCLLRFNTDGSRDTTFGSGGEVVTSIDAGHNYPHVVRVQADGKILVGGQCTNGCMVRYLPSGALDLSFGVGGKVNERAWIGDMVIDTSGRIWTNGIQRWRKNGTPDLSFNGTGTYAAPIDVSALFMLDPGRLLVAGSFKSDDLFARSLAAIRLLIGPDSSGTTAARSDFGGEGRSDILWHNSATGMLYQLQMNGQAVATTAVIDQETDLNWKAAAVADLDGDLRSDIVWQNQTTGQVYGLIMSGTTVLAEGTIYVEPNIDWKIVGAGDFNGDGNADLLWKNSVTGDVFLLLMNGLTVMGGGVIYSEPNPNWQIQKVADFNGDGRADLLWRNVATGDVFVLLMNGTTVTGGGVIYSEPNTSWQIQAAADFNGDGRADVLWRNTATGDVYMMLMNGTTITGGSVFYSEPNSDWKIAATGDYNGDGRADILWRNGVTGEVFMMLMDGFTVTGGGFVYTEPDQNWRILGP